jgi:hypothetical protein
VIWDSLEKRRRSPSFVWPVTALVLEGGDLEPVGIVRKMGQMPPIPGSIAPETTGLVRDLAVQILHQRMLFGRTQIGCP